MWVLLVVGYIMLQVCTGEGGTTPGTLTTTATSGPTGAKAGAHTCCLTAVVTSHCCTGLERRKWKEGTEGLRGEETEGKEVSEG